MAGKKKKLTKSKLGALYRQLIQPYALEEGNDNIEAHANVRRDALEQLFEAGQKEHVAQLCDEEGALASLAMRIVAGIESLSTLTFLLEKLEASPEQVTRQLGRFVAYPADILKQGSPNETLDDVIDAFVAAGAHFDIAQESADCLLSQALQNDIREDWVRGMVEKIADETSDDVVARVAEQRLVAYRKNDVLHAALEWLLARKPPEAALQLGLVSASILSMDETVRTLAAPFDVTFAARTDVAVRLSGVTGAGSKPAYVNVKAGDNPDVVCGRLIAALGKTISGLEVDEGPYTEDRLRVSRERLAVVEHWPHTAISSDTQRSPLIADLCRLLESTEEIDALIDASQSAMSQYMAAVRLLQQKPELLRAFTGEHPLGLILRREGPGLSVVNDTDPEDYPAEAQSYLPACHSGSWMRRSTTGKRRVRSCSRRFSTTRQVTETTPDTRGICPPASDST